jgi:acyl phosphate:glycerol-3-phosphate acyltransferase
MRYDSRKIRCPLYVKRPVTTLTLTFIAYLIGSLSFAVIASRAFGLPDPRSYGSGNPGATNVLRTGKKKAAVLTLAGDSVKGWLAVFIAGRYGEAAQSELAMAWAGAAVIVGHMYPVFFRFQGGKGVSTALGVLFAFNIYLAVGTLGTWLIIFYFFRISSLAALIAALFAPFFTLLLYHSRHEFFAAVVLIAALLMWRHKTNIRNLLAGTEGRVQNTKTL